MLTNFVVDDERLMRLIEKAQQLGQHQTQEEAVETGIERVCSAKTTTAKQVMGV